MSDIVAQDVSQNVGKEEAYMPQLLLEMQRLNEKMRQDQAQIELIKMDTEALKAESARYKLETEKLRVQGDSLHVEIRTMLDRLKGMVSA